MPFVFPSRIKYGIALPILAVSLLACVSAWAQVSNTPPAVQTYDNGPASIQVPTGPIAPGSMTIEDVLKAHPPKQRLSIQPLTAPPAPVAAAPLLTPPARESSTSLMMMQGLKSVLQQSGSSAAPLLKPPIMPGNEKVAAQRAMANPVNVPLAPGVQYQYQPGQAPKDLATTALEAAGAAPPAANPTPPPSGEAVTVSTTAGACEVKTTTWVKSCSDAGYPEDFVGSVQGETRVTCPDSALQDVWVSNTCAAPKESDLENSATAPLSAPTSPPLATAALNQNDASCGPANGLTADAMPSADLCNAGEPTMVTGEGPWRWSCNGHQGGMTVSCAAPASPKAAVAAQVAETSSPPQENLPPVVEDGQCGPSDGVGAEQAPSGNLCNKGTPSRVNGSGPWTWACSGMNGGQATACTAPRIIEGACGSASQSAAGEMPTSDLCAAGFASAVTGSGPWSWTCSGLYGGQAATCSATPKQDAVCGSASLKGQHQAPAEGLCSIGEASSVSGNGPWSWTCNGANGGSSVSCEARSSVNGSCGAANGVAVAEAPAADLCAQGKASRVTGIGPWSWNCTGEEGGDTESCTAPRMSEPKKQPPAAAAAPKSKAAAKAAKGKTAAAKPVENPAEKPAEPTTSSAVVTKTTSSVNLCGSAAELAAIEQPDKNLCKGGTASKVEGEGPWSWTCADDAGHKSACSTLGPAAPTASETAASEPAAEPEAQEAAMPPPHKAEVAPVAPTAPSEAVAACGSAMGQGTAKAPEDNLCATGKASKVRGSGPWDWTCTKGKSKVSCEASKLVDGICGVTNGTAQKAAPTSGLCNAGTPTAVQGDGPWLWSCVGTGGGASISCSAASQAQARIDGACGTAANGPTPSAPKANLCDSGVASTVYGDGPWTWTCSGLNGGIASSCSTQKNMPPAPPAPGPPVNGLCGSSNGVAMLAQPEDDLCSAGTVTAVSGNGPWNWNCIGENGGMTVSCTAPLQPPAPITGSCGGANGVPTLTTPKSGLCSAGISSAVSGHGPWTWSCSGTNGGGAVGCVAPMAGTGAGASGLPSLTAAPSGEPTSPQAAPQVPVTSGHLVTPSLPKGTLPPLETGTMPQLTPSKAFDRPPEPSAAPPVPAPDQGTLVPGGAPDLPPGTQPLQPPPVREALKPSPALEENKDNAIQGNRFALDEDVSAISFERGSENIGPSETQQLDKLAAILQAHPGLRITLTAYASVSDSTPREARRLSLSRALTVRDYLTAKGISSSRIDVRALGANVASGDPDRVDVKAD
jgi:outer membrane protein OmpA-like peptidoglycan-associated protein